MRSAAVVFNPLAGRRVRPRLVRRVLEALKQSGFDAEPLATNGPGGAVDRAREAAARGAEVIFALGGDGTLRECAGGVLGSSAALAFLPTGTMNVMALELGVPRTPVRAAQAFRHSREVRFGVGMAGEVPFLMQFSAGVDAFLIASLRPPEKKWLGMASVVPAMLRSLLRYHFPSFEIEAPSGRHRVTLAVASNIRRYGGPLVLTPEARSDGGGLELFRFSGLGRRGAMRFALSLLVGRHLRMRDSGIERVRQATFRASPDVPLQIDGDLLPAGEPVVATLATGTIGMLVPGH